MTTAVDLIYLTEAQWRALAELLPQLNREVGLFQTSHGYPLVMYGRGSDLILSSESAFAGEFTISPDGTAVYPADWNE